MKPFSLIPVSLDSSSLRPFINHVYIEQPWRHPTPLPQAIVHAATTTHKLTFIKVMHIEVYPGKKIVATIFLSSDWAINEKEQAFRKQCQSTDHTS